MRGEGVLSSGVEKMSVETRLGEKLQLTSKAISHISFFPSQLILSPSRSPSYLTIRRRQLSYPPSVHSRALRLTLSFPAAACLLSSRVPPTNRLTPALRIV